MAETEQGALVGQTAVAQIQSGKLPVKRYVIQGFFHGRVNHSINRTKVKTTMSYSNINSPLVTFAIIAYNQREYILDAIKGAFMLQYDNLEIIISDDNSTDGTYELIEYFLAHNSCKHSVKLNRTKENVCVLEHFFQVVDLASGELIVLAAGDDISYPERVSDTVTTWKKDQSVGLYACYDLINNNGTVVESRYLSGINNNLDNIFGKPMYYQIHGASSAYDLNFAKSLPRPQGRFFFEDTYMSFMIRLHGLKVSKIDKPLVAYRAHPDSLSNSFNSSKSYYSVYERECKSQLYSRVKFELLCYLYDYAKNYSSSNKPCKLNFSELNKAMIHFEIKGNWINYSISKRFVLLVSHYSSSALFFWMLPRVFGYKCFSVLRNIL